MIKKGWKDMELDKELIQLRIDVIERDLAEINKIVEEGYENFKTNFRNELASKQALLESIEACIDISNHIIATQGFRRPTDYKDVFVILEENGFLERNLSGKLQEMAKFRNLLVHRYAEMDKERLFRIMKADIDDIKVFVEKILRYMSIG
ncbi:MAG: DUF86 domain-containing protein [Euryarchaeota archaeon]|nr:DUF86 domain-containing protein [Euryarchaeota archaeon]